MFILKKDANMLQQCKRVGVDLSWRCNWNCATCFYHHDKRLHTADDRDLKDIERDIAQAKQRGCNHVVFVGYGEPAIAPNVHQAIINSVSSGMQCSMITNGSAPVENYAQFHKLGLNHLHVSTHGIGAVLDRIADREKAYERQIQLLNWLADENLPWRSNTTLQQLNYKQLPEIVEQNIYYGVRHFVFLGFLPHYGFTDPVNAKTVMVNPNDLRQYIEAGAEKLLEAGVDFTIRYHPFCCIDRKYWPHIVNARYVLYDSTEWEYGHCGESDDIFRRHAIELGEAVAIGTEPCKSCDVREHCGGWNKYSFGAMDNKGLTAIKEERKPFGYYFEQYKFNTEFPGHY